MLALGGCGGPGEITAVEPTATIYAPPPTDIPAPPPEMLEFMATLPPGPGIGEPDDVAWTVVFMASDESKHINGVELPVDNTTVVYP